jgi:hypothetical protein
VLKNLKLRNYITELLVMANEKKLDKNQQKNPKHSGHSGGCCQPTSQEKSKQPHSPPSKKPGSK